MKTVVLNRKNMKQMVVLEDLQKKKKSFTNTGDLDILSWAAFLHIFPDFLKKLN